MAKNQQITVSTGDAAFDAKLESLDDDLNPIVETPVEKVEDVPEETTEEVVETEEEVEPTEEEVEPESTEESEEETEPADEGYTIDGDEEAEETVDVPVGDKEVEVKRTDLTPEQNYILDNLQPIKVRGTVGNSDEVKEFDVLSPEYLPQGFKYLDERESSIANKSFALLENRAVELQNAFRNQETIRITREFKEREDTADTADIGELQRAGELPLFKVSPDDPKFVDDPGVKLVQEILDFKETTNQRYAEEFNAGRPYRHIGFKEAMAMYNRETPKVDTKQAKEDADREAVAKRTVGTKGDKGKSQTPHYQPGMTGRDLDMLLENLTEGW